MARPLRIEFRGAVYHITGRTNAGQSIFLDNSDRETFLTLLSLEYRIGYIVEYVE